MIVTRLFLATAAVNAFADTREAHAQVLGPTAASGSVFTLQGLVLCLTIIAGVVALLMQGRKVRREAEDDARKRTSEILGEVRENRRTTDDRVKELEVKAADFMSRAEIEGKIEHEKGNRVASDQALRIVCERHDSAISDIRVDIGKIGERHDGMSRDIADVKGMMKELAADVKAGFKEISEHRKTA